MSDSSNIVYYSEISSPIGALTIASTAKGICAITFGRAEDNLFSLTRWAKRWLNTDSIVEEHRKLANAKEQLNEYFEGKRRKFELDVDLYGTPFQKLIWEQLLLIPYGEVRTYKDIAIQINAPKSVRAIGSANHNNPVSIVVPCHRVIGSNGNLVGYGGGLEKKQYLLELEGYAQNLKKIL